MATNGSFLTSAWTSEAGNLFRLVFKWSTKTQSIENNYSIINWSIEGYTNSNGGWVYTQNITLKIDNNAVFQHVMSEDGQLKLSNGAVLASGEHTISHTADGSKSFVAYLEAGIWNWEPNCSGTSTFTLDTIPRAATLLTAPNFNDEENPIITYSNPAGNSATSLRACISLDGTNADIAYRDISKTGTSYTFNLTTAERDVLRAATTGSNSREVLFYIRTIIGEMNEASILYRTLTIKNPEPTINPTIVDTNSKTIALTGDSSKIVRYCSNAKITIGASAVKKASLTSKQVVCGTSKLTADGTINAVSTNIFTFTATDNRGNTTRKKVTPSFVNYIKPTCSLANNMPDGEGNMTVRVTGNYFNGFFGKENNALNVYYRYKIAGTEWTDSNTWTLMSATLDGNTYVATANVSGLDYQTVYVFQAYAKDVLTVTSNSERNVKATPVFDWGDSDFKFNVPVYDQNGVLIGPTEIVKLWTNPNTSVAFEPQTVSLSLSNYSLVIIDFGSSNIDTIPYGDARIIRKNSRRNVMGFTSYICSRPVVIKDTGVTFEAGKVYKTYGTPTSDNNYMVPLIIYGIRGVT